MLVHVRDNNVDQALKALKKKMQREGIFREMKLRNYYEKPSERRVREQAEAVRRARKLARKRAQREGLLPGKPATPTTGAGPAGLHVRAVRPAVAAASAVAAAAVVGLAAASADSAELRPSCDCRLRRRRMIEDLGLPRVLFFCARAAFPQPPDPADHRRQSLVAVDVEIAVRSPPGE